MKQPGEIEDRDLARKLEALRPAPARHPQAAARGRAAFLDEAAALRPAVSAAPQRRHTGWKRNLPTLTFRKERSPMFTTLVSIAVALTLVLGGAGATAFASQDSLPGQPLYGVKTFTENARLDMAGDPQARLQLSLDYATRRLEEIRRQAGRGQVSPEAIQERLRVQLDDCLKLAAGLPDDDLTPALDRIRLRLQDQDRLMDQAMQLAPEEGQPALTQARATLRLRLELVEAGLGDPQTFRQRLRLGPGQPGQPTPPALNGNGPRPTGQPQATPGGGFGPGPGPAPSSTCTPHNGPGPQPVHTEEPGYGPGPRAAGTATPGSGYGPVPGPNPSATPAGPGPKPQRTPGAGDGPRATQAPKDGTGPGPQPTSPPQDGNGPGPGAGPGPQPTQAPQGGNNPGTGGRK